MTTKLQACIADVALHIELDKEIDIYCFTHLEDQMLNDWLELDRQYESSRLGAIRSFENDSNAPSQTQKV